MSLSHFTFNGKSSGDFGLLVSNVSAFGAPARVVEKVQIPYRNGDLLIDTGAYQNYIVTYEVAIIQNTDINMRNIADWLLNTNGYCELSDDYTPDYYRLGAYYNQIDYTMTMLNRYGSATISFDCKPQRYLNSGKTAQSFTASGTIINPTHFDSKPLIEVTGRGYFTVNGTTIYVGNNPTTTIIDSERMQVYRDGVNASEFVAMDDYPTLQTGSNTITITSSTITRVDITPRWWRL